MIEIKMADPTVRIRTAFMKAKTNGFLSMVNFQLENFPKEITEFNQLDFDNGKSWEDFDLNRIDLSHNAISEIDSSIANIQGLVQFKMIHNKLTNIPTEIFLLSSQKVIDLSYNSICNIPDKISECVLLKEINFTGNKLTKLPENLKNLINLEKLFISENSLEELSNDIGMMGKLLELNASHNKISRVEFKFQDSALRVINLSRNVISYLHPNCFDGLSFLTMIELKQNQLREFSQFPTSKNLETVSQCFNKITDIYNLYKSKNVINLDLKDNKLEKLTDEIFLLQNLKLLDLSNNDLQSLPNEIGLIKTLTKCLIDGNPLKTIRMQIRQGGTEALKKYLAARVDITEHQKKQDTNFKDSRPQNETLDNNILNNQETPPKKLQNSLLKTTSNERDNDKTGQNQEPPQKNNDINAQKIQQIKNELIEGEFFIQQSSEDEVWKQLLRDNLNSNGDLR